MTQKTRANLTTEITTLIADAPAANISAADVRTVLNNSKDSNLNILTDTSDDLTEGSSKLLLSPTERSKTAREWHAQIFTTGVNYTPNITTALTHGFTAPGGDKDFVTVEFEGVPQSQNSWSVAGAVITFTSAIPVGVDFVQINVLA